MAAGAPPAPRGAGAPQPLRIMTWNVNGLASVCARRGLAAFLNRLEGADVVALQVWRWYSQQHALLAATLHAHAHANAHAL